MVQYNYYKIYNIKIILTTLNFIKLYNTYNITYYYE